MPASTRRQSRHGLGGPAYRHSAPTLAETGRPRSNVLSLQATAGNHAVSALLARAGISSATDSRERDAERVAASYDDDPGAALDTGAVDPGRRRESDDIRIHTDEAAGAAADRIGASAFTAGNDIFFAPDRFDPSSSRGGRLLAHELAHVAQQQSGEASPAVVQREEAPTPQADAAEPDARTPEGGTDGAAEEQVWIRPPGLRERAEPVYDEETRAVIAFRYSSGGYYEIYDLEGKIVETGEPGLESPLIDPIDILAGGLVGLGRSVLGAGARAGVRAAATAVAEEGGVVAARGGLRAAAAAIGARALTAARAAWRAIRLRGALRFTETAGARMAQSGRFVPVHILRLAIRWGVRTADPQGVPGAFRYVIPMLKGARDATGRWVYKQYLLEVVLRESDNTVLHFLYRL